MTEHQYTHHHAEAFRLMRYQADDGTEDEWIWNSRDGVTPFIVTLRSGKSARHVNWAGDIYNPDHRPKPGDRIFVDLTPERAIEKRRVFVDLWWDNPKMPMRDHAFLGPMGKEGAARHLALQDLGDEFSRSPDLIEVV